MTLTLALCSRNARPKKGGREPETMPSSCSRNAHDKNVLVRQRAIERSTRLPLKM